MFFAFSPLLFLLSFLLRVSLRVLSIDVSLILSLRTLQAEVDHARTT